MVTYSRLLVPLPVKLPPRLTRAVNGELRLGAVQPNRSVAPDMVSPPLPMFRVVLAVLAAISMRLLPLMLTVLAVVVTPLLSPATPCVIVKVPVMFRLLILFVLGSLTDEFNVTSWTVSALFSELNTAALLTVMSEVSAIWLAASRISDPPLTSMLPAIALPADLFSRSVPPLTVVTPVYVLETEPERVRVPPPVLVRAPFWIVGLMVVVPLVMSKVRVAPPRSINRGPSVLV